MSRVRVISPNEGVFIGPAPDSGYHFLSYSGTLNDNYNDLIKNYNLLQELERVQAVSYSIDIPRIDIKQLGTQSLVDRAAINYPSIQLSIDYLLKGVLNEARLGLGVNYARFEYPYSGAPFYPTGICPISGLIDRHLTRASGLPYWPYSYRDKRNIFIPLAPEGVEIAENRFREDFSTADSLQGINPYASGYQVVGFGGCYLDSYSTSAQVGGPPRASVTYTCDNVQFYTSGSGIVTPTVSTKSRLPLSNRMHAVIPLAASFDGPAVLKPSDITVDISSTGNPGLNDFGFNFNDIKIDSYQLSFSLNRQSLNSLGYKLAIDRVPTFPILVNVGFTAIVGDGISGSCLNLVNQDNPYNITIKARNSICIDSGNATNPRQDGPFMAANAVALQYNFYQAVCKSISYKGTVGTNKVVSFGFESEIDPQRTDKGFFISGLLNVAKVQDFLLNDSDNTFLLYPDNSPIVLGYPPLY